MLFRSIFPILVEHEHADTRIGKITNIEVRPTVLRVSYQFSKDRYPLTKGALEQNWQMLGINKPNLEFYRTHWAVKECDISAFYEQYLKTLAGIAHKLKDTDKKVQLIYAFNGTGKTRLSREFRDLIMPDIEETNGERSPKVIYYNAFTEDLFYWDNDLKDGVDRKLKIQPNSYTQWILQEQGQDQNAITYFQRYTNDKLTPRFNEEYKTKNDDEQVITIPPFSEVTFSFERGNYERDDRIKISKGEESNFIWSIFYSLINQSLIL